MLAGLQACQIYGAWALWKLGRRAVDRTGEAARDAVSPALSESTKSGLDSPMAFYVPSLPSNGSRVDAVRVFRLSA